MSAQRFNNELWKRKPLDLQGGFSDLELEELCKPESESGRLGWTRIPWLFHSSEVYGFGRSFRSISGWPNYLPIPVSSDHGINFSNYFAPHDEQSPSRVFLTWSRWRTGIFSNNKRIVHVIHPWIGLRRIKGWEKRPDAAGTLLFAPHSLPWTDFPDFNWKSFWESFQALEKNYRPRAVVVHEHDIRKGLHRSLRELKLPIFTLGDHKSPLFVERFYDLVSRFDYVTSPNLGSHALYAEELGVQFFLWGSFPQPVGLLAEEIAPPESEDYVLDKLREVFGEFPPRRTWERFLILEFSLGISHSIHEDGSKLRRLFFREMVMLPAYFLRWGVTRLFPRNKCLAGNGA